MPALTHFHIFASLPGLNGPAFVLPGDSLECREKCRTGQHETLVKDLSDLRPHSLNHYDTNYLHQLRHDPGRRWKTVESMIQKQR